MNETRALTPWLGPRRHFIGRLEWKLADVWVGLFWHRGKTYVYLGFARWARYTDLWVCLLPCLPLHFRWRSAFLDQTDIDDCAELAKANAFDDQLLSEHPGGNHD